jgi:hypothetical protein
MASEDDRRSIFRRTPPVVGPVVPRRERPPAPVPDEGPSDDDLRRFGEVTVTCKHCGTELYDDAAICYTCGRSILGDEAKGLPTWAWMVAVVLIATLLIFTLGPPLGRIFGP